MAVPTLVQSTTSAFEVSGTGGPWQDLYYNLPHPTLAGNCLLLWIEVSGGATFTITDDGSGNTWTAVRSIVSSQALYTYVCPNVSAGTQRIRVQFNTTRQYYRGGCSEFNNVATSSPIDASVSSAGSGTAASTAITTATADCLIVQISSQEAVDGYYGKSITPHTGFGLLHADLWDGSCSQYGVQSGSGAITPVLTWDPTTSWLNVTIALKNATAGSPMPTGVVRVRRRQFSSGLPNPFPSNMANPVKVQMPTEAGSLVALSFHAYKDNNLDHSVSSVVDQDSNNFFAAAVINTFNIFGARVDSSIWYSSDASPTTPIMTVTFATPVVEATLAAYELVGIDNTAPLGATATSTGQQTSAGNLTTGTITPQRVGSIVLGMVPVDAGAISGTTSPSARVFDGFFSTGMNGGFNRLEEDNGHGFYVNASLAQQTWTWTNSQPTGGVNFWSSILAEFLPPVTSGVVVSGTATANIAQSDVVAGGKTIIATLVGDTYVPASAGGITFVGRQSGSFAGKTATTSVTFALTGGIASVPAANDFVLVSYAVGSVGDVALTINDPSATAYTLINTELFADDTIDTNLRVAYRFMPGTPDTTLTLSGTSSTANAGAYTIHVFRGVDATTPLDVAAISATGINGRLVNPGAITPTTAGAMIYVAGAAGCGTGGTFAVSYVSGLAVTTQVDTNDVNIASGYVSWTSGAYDPAAFTGGGTTTTSDSWAAMTVALRPVVTTPFADARAAIQSGIDSAQSQAGGWDAKVKPNIPLANIVRTSDTVVTVTLQAQADYTISAPETITVTMPGAAMVGGSPVVATPTFTVAVTAGEAISQGLVVGFATVAAVGVGLKSAVGSAAGAGSASAVALTGAAVAAAAGSATVSGAGTSQSSSPGAVISGILEQAMSAAVTQATSEGISTNESNAPTIHGRILTAYQDAIDSIYGVPANGLDFPGSGPVVTTMRFKFSNPHSNGLPIYGPSGQGNTLIWRCYPRQQASYYTIVFWANDNGAGDLSSWFWNAGNIGTTWGFHPYPNPAPNGTNHDWEIACEGNDTVNGAVQKDRWFTQAIRVWGTSGNVKHHEYYWDWPNTDAGHMVSYITSSSSWGDSNPPFPALTIADAPHNQGAECFNGVLRGFQFYNNLLTLTEIGQEISTPLSSAKSGDIWYLNMDPTPTDISDKSGQAHHPAWVGSERPTLYVG